MKGGILDFIRNQWAKPVPVVRADLTGKTVVTIGANTGIGFEAVKHFATMNPGRLILACRSEKKGKDAIASEYLSPFCARQIVMPPSTELQSSTGYDKAELWLVDLSRYPSVLEFANKFELDGGRLDILVENAAMVPLTFRQTSDGYEESSVVHTMAFTSSITDISHYSVQVNYLALSLLALRLMPRMLDTARKYSTVPRLVVVSSEMHYWIRPKQDIPASADSKIIEWFNDPRHFSSTPPIKIVLR